MKDAQKLKDRQKFKKRKRKRQAIQTILGLALCLGYLLFLMAQTWNLSPNRIVVIVIGACIVVLLPLKWMPRGGGD